MPIKSCSRCGLKVLVDAQAANVEDFLCTRCAPNAAPAPASAPPPKPAGGKRPSVKVTCPYCGASFSGSKPSRPAKGGCPVCQKELVLLPDGTIQAAATFNLASWQKEKKSASNPPSSPPPAPAQDLPVEMPSTPDPLGGSTILDMGGPPVGSSPPSLPTIDEPTMAMPAGIGGETMLGMGSDAAPPSAPEPTIDEPPPAPPPYEEPEAPPDLGGATILDMGPRPVEMPPPDIAEESPQPDLLKETMPGYDRPPSSESPVDPPTPPPIPEETYESPEVTEGPTIRDPEPEPEPEPEPAPTVEEEASAASIESAPEIPADLGGQTILGMGEDLTRQPDESVPSIEEPLPEAVPILAKDIHPPDGGPDLPPDGSEAPAPGQATPKPYVYQPIPRVPRKPPPHSAVPPSGPASPPPMAIQRESSSAGPPPPPASSAPVLGSDFRIASAPPAPKPPEKSREEKKPAGPKTSAVVLPRAEHSVGKLATAWVLLALPAALAFGLHSFQKNPTAGNIIQKCTDQVLPGIKKIRSEIEKAVKAKPEGTPAESK